MNNSFRRPEYESAKFRRPLIEESQQRDGLWPGLLGMALTVLAHAGLYAFALWLLRDAGAISWTIAWWKLNLFALANVALKIWVKAILTPGK